MKSVESLNPSIASESSKTGQHALTISHQDADSSEDYGVNFLEILPSEIVHEILEYLPKKCLHSFAASCQQAYGFASAYIWKDVILSDCKTKRSLTADQLRCIRSYADGPEQTLTDTALQFDHHDDTPIIKTLVLLVKRPDLAKKVRTVTHRCHLPGPDIFSELNDASFESQSLSGHPRTFALLRLAIRNLVNVHTLRLSFPHYFIAQTLLNDFFDYRRPRNVSVQRLWLENCDLHFDMLYSGHLDMSALTGVRIRRVKLDYRGDVSNNVSVSRSGISRLRQNGRGSCYISWCHTPLHRKDFNLDSYYEPSTIFDAIMYQNISEAKTLMLQNQQLLESMPSHLLDHKDLVSDTCQQLNGSFALYNEHHINKIAKSSHMSLKHLNLDWIVCHAHNRADGLSMKLPQYRLLAELSKIEFPNLRSFEIRNTITDSTRFPWHLFLLHPTDIIDISDDPNAVGDDRIRTVEADFLRFLEHHPKLVNLGWPLDFFFPATHSVKDNMTQDRVTDVIHNLGNNLETLRLDSVFHNSSENQSRLYDANNPPGSRHRFLSEFIGYMTKIKTIKVEGAFTRDEKREILRGLRNCPIERVVFIGRSFPLGNTWGPGAEYLEEFEEDLFEGPNDIYEAENIPVLQASTHVEPKRPKIVEPFKPVYGWDGTPLLLTIASCFSDTVTELKFCGFNGSPIFTRPESENTDVTPALLHHLRYFDKLELLVLSLHIFRDSTHERADILETWSGNGYDDMDNLSLYEPAAMSESLSEMIRPYLSPVVLERGLKFRASFCIGTEPYEDIFDIDIDLDATRVRDFTGPRTAVHFSRWWSKLTERRYF